ncbi:adhesion G-protein coupled receptor G2 isoform X1 [Pogona vitticeps]
MTACGLHCRWADRISEILLRCKVSVSFFLLHLILATSGRAEVGFLGRYRAVFNTSCEDAWTLSPRISVPALRNFTVCVYFKLYSPKNNWTAFVYSKAPDGNLSASDHYELGLTGSGDKLTVWMFGKEITWSEELDEDTWYQICIRWQSGRQEASVYINGKEKRSEKLSETRQLLANGQLLLGCPQNPDVSSPSPDGMVGELYMFRMWSSGDINHTQDCRDGTIIRWRNNNWVYNNKTKEYSRSLPCADATDISSGFDKLSSTPADSSIVTFVTYPNSATDPSTAVTLNTAEMTTGMEYFPATMGTKGIDNNVCNLSVLCNDTVFYMGTMKFQTTENSSDTSYNLKLHYPGDNTSQYEIKATSTALSRVKISDFNETLQRLSDSSLMQCAPVNQSISDCNFIIKLQKNLNISYILLDLQEKAEIGPVESCCCSPLEPHTCPSTVEELRLLQCGMHETVACTDSSTGLPVASSTAVTPFLTGLTTAEYSNISTLWNTNTHPPTEEITPAPSIKSTNTVGPFGTTNPAFSAMPSTKTTTSLAVPSITAAPHSSSSTKTTAAAFTSMLSTSFDTHSTTGDAGNTSKATTEQVSQNHPNITDSSGGPDVEKIVSQLEGNLTAETIAPSFAKTMLESVSFLLDKPQSQISPMSKRIIKIVDAIGLKLNFSTESIELTSSALALAVLKVNSSSFNSVSFAVEDSSDLQVTLGTQVPTNNVGAITLPSSVMSNLPFEDKHLASRITFNFFEKTTLFQDPSLKNMSLISHVISSSVANLTINNLKTNVTVTLKSAGPSQDNSTVRCAFWDFTKNGGVGGWAYEGCVVKERRSNETVCSCNHLTSFGVLLDLSRNITIPAIQVLILTFITYIGCGLSAIFLSITLVTYIAFEKIRRDYPSKILIQLCVALLLLNLVFLLDSWIALYENKKLCISVAVFLHYFLLVSFTWMGLEAFHMYLALVKVFNTYVRKYILKFCIVGWGVPAIVIVIVLAISPDNYGLDSYGKFPNGSSDEFCWINSDIIFYITVVGYFCIIFLLNISMFIVVLIQLCRIKKKKQLGAQRKTSIQDLRSVAGLTFLLGVTWGFAFFAWGPVNLVFMYLFAIFNTLQGFFIFIFYCVAKENVRKQWRRYLCCGKYRLAENSDWSRTATNGLKKQNVNQGVSSSSHSLQSNSNSTNSTSMLMNNDHSVHANGNGNAPSEKNGVSFNVQNGEVQLPDFSGKQFVLQENNDTSLKKSCISLRRTSKRGSLHFIEPM